MLRKQFFFEKKNQKTFTHWDAYSSDSKVGFSPLSSCPTRATRQTRKSFLFLFFKKEILPCFALALLFILIAAGDAHAAWWNGDWQYRVKIDADAGPKGANIGDPIGRTQVLIRLTQGNFKFDSAKQDGSDIRFVGGDDKTPLHYHIERWDGLVDQVALIWVDVPDLAPGTATPLFMYWGNPKAEDGSDAHATYDPDQLLVWHFADQAGLPHDSTGYNNNALTPAVRDEAGIIGLGAKLAGTMPIKLAPSASLNLTAGETYTWQVWEKAAAPNETSILYDQRDTGGVAGFQVGFAAGVPYAEATPAAGPAVRAQAGAPIAGDGWHLITVTASADKLRVYVDGAKVAEAAGGLPAIDGASVLAGAAVAAAAVTPPAATPGAPVVAPAAPPANFQGELDELEISKVVRQDGAIAVAVHSQGPNANLLVFEAPEQTSGFSTGYIGILLHSITPDAMAVIGILMAMMLISWLVMFNRGVVVARTRGANKKFRRTLRDVMREDRAALLPNVPKDRTKTLSSSSLLAIYETGCREVNERLHGGRTLPDGTIAPQSLAAIRSSMDAQMVREIDRLNNLMVLLTIAIAGGPFIGLLGTVVGVMITFAAIAAAGDVNVNAIAPGIAAALLATVAGLAVAIPSLFGYNYLQVRIKGIISEMSVFVDEIVTRIAEGDLAIEKRQQLAE
jgi:biopolymer transport protein ExbB